MPKNNFKDTYGRIYNIFGICNYMPMHTAWIGNMGNFCLQIGRNKIGSLQFGAFTGIHGGLCNPKLMGHWNSWMSWREKLLHAKYLRWYYLLTGHELGSWNFYYDGRMEKKKNLRRWNTTLTEDKGRPQKNCFVLWR